jgi:phosphatidylglycerophosphatase A
LSDSQTHTRQRRGGWPILLATGFGAGYGPVCPGTWGALVGVPIVAACHLPSWPWSAVASGVAIVVLLLAGVWLSRRGAAHFGDEDPKPVVIDEIASLPITFFLIPRMDLWILGLGFCLNRAADILKPPPARQLEHVGGGWGIMLDDTFAGLYSGIALHLFYWLVWARIDGAGWWPQITWGG